MKIERNTVIKAFKISVGITVLTVVLVLIFTISKETLKSFREFQPVYLGAIFPIIFVHYLLDCLRLQTLTSVVGKRVSLKASMKFTLGSTFMGIVPFGVATFPFQLYILNKEGIKPGKATSVIIMTSALLWLVLPFILPFLVSFYRGSFTQGFVPALVKYILIFLTIGVIFWLFMVLEPSYRIRVFLSKFIKGERGKKIVEKIVEELDNFKESLKEYYRKGKLKLVESFLLTCASRGMYFFFPYVLLHGLGQNPPLGQTMMIQIVLTHIVPYMPTPGASGIAELSGMGLYSAVCPKYLLGIYITLWRFFSFYLKAILGGGIFLRMIYRTERSATFS